MGFIRGEVPLSTCAEFSGFFEEVPCKIVATGADEAFRQVTQEGALLPARQHFHGSLDFGECAHCRNRSAGPNAGASDG